MTANIKGYSVEVDKIDFPLAMERGWCRTGSRGRKVYFGRNRNGEIVTLHRLIVGAVKGQLVDHIDGDTLNNKRRNLRIVSPLQNAWNSEKHKDNTSGYKGVSWDKRTKRWCASIFIKGKNVWLGRFLSPREASEEYKKAATRFFGEYAKW